MRQSTSFRNLAWLACFLAFGLFGLVTGARGRVDAALSRGDLTGAGALQDRLAILRLDAPEQRLALAHALVEADRLDDAAAQFDRALALSPQGEEWAALAAVHVRRGDPEAAIAAWERGFETNGDPRYLHRASKLLLARGETERAFAHSERALLVDPPSSMIHARISNLARLMNLPHHEIRHLRTAAALEPTRRTLREQLAWRLATCAPPTRNGEESVQLAEALVAETGRRDANLLDTLAAGLAAAGRYDAAVLVAAEADDLASRLDEQALAAAIRERLALYRSGKSYLEPAARPQI